MKKPGDLYSVLFLFFCLVGTFPGLNPEAYAAPEKIIPGNSYYSDDYVELNQILELAEEKNLEEVYQHYQYYEAIYNNHKKILQFKCYKRGKLEWQEQYFYDEQGKLLKKEIDSPGNKKEIVKFY